MKDVCVIDDPASASVALDPVRSRLLSELRAPMSAATLAGRMGFSPGALGPVAADPERGMDRLSLSYLVALAARVVREVGQLLRKSERTQQAPCDTLHRHRGEIPVRRGPCRVQQ